MSESALRDFVLDALADLGASLSEGGSLVWVRLPDAVRSELELPATLAITFDPERAGEFDAELVAPGSFFLERLMALARCRGRWGAARLDAPDPRWVDDVLKACGLGPDVGVRSDDLTIDHDVLFLLTFRLSLVSDEKRESLHTFVVSSSGGEAWRVARDVEDARLMPWTLPEPPRDLDRVYRLASDRLREDTREDIDGFRAVNLRLLEEEVRRIFGYFDATVAAVQEADPGASSDLLRAIRAERDRRLAETVDRFDPEATASLCAIRAISVPGAHGTLEWGDGVRATVRLDPWSRRVRGLRCEHCGTPDGPWRPSDVGMRCAACPPTQAASARPRARRRSDTPR